MRAGAIRLFAVPPGTRHLAPLLAQFCKSGYGVITGTSDAAVATARWALPAECEFDILPLGTLVQNALNRTELPAATLVHSGHYTAAISEALGSLDEGSFLWPCRKFPGVHRAVGDVLKELSQFEVGLDAPTSGSAPVRKKLADFAAVEHETASILKSVNRQTHVEQLRALLDLNRVEGLPSKVWIQLDSQVSPLHVQLIQWLRANGVSVWLVGVSGADPTLYSWMNWVQHAVEAPIENNGANPTSPQIVIRSSADAFAEAEDVIGQCAQLLHDGVATSSIGIYARSLEHYSALLQCSAEAKGLSLACPRRVPLLENAFARLSLETLRALSGADVRRLDIVVRSTYLAFEAKTRTETLQILSEAHRSRTEPWIALSEALTASGDTFSVLAEIVQIGREAASRFDPLDHWCGFLRDFIDKLPKSSASEHVARDHRAGTVMQRTLQEAAAVRRLRNHSPLGFTAFVRECERIWSSADVSLPVRGSGIRVASSLEQLGDREHIFSLGMMESVFPRRRRENPLLNDEEREEISRVHKLKRALPNSRDEQARERELFYELCAAATGRLTLSYPRFSEDRENTPSFFLQDLESKAEVQEVKPEQAEAKAIPLPHLVLPKAHWEQTTFRPSELRQGLQCGFQHFARHRLDLQRQDIASNWHSLRRLPTAANLASATEATEGEFRLRLALQEAIDEKFGELPSWEIPLLLSGGKRLVREWIEREFAAREAWPKDSESLQTDVRFGKDLRADMGRGVHLSGQVQATSRMGDYAVVHVVESRTPTIEEGILSDPDALYYGLYLLAISQQATSAAVEVDGMDGRRVLMVVPRLPGTVLPSRMGEQIKFVALDPRDDPYETKRAFFERVKKLLWEAVGRIREGDIAPRPGEHCRWCDYAELCRRSRDFGEEVSDFELDRLRP